MIDSSMRPVPAMAAAVLLLGLGCSVADPAVGVFVGVAVPPLAAAAVDDTAGDIDDWNRAMNVSKTLICPVG